MKAELKRLKKSINEKTAYETLYENYEKDLKSKVRNSSANSYLKNFSNGCFRNSRC